MGCTRKRSRSSEQASATYLRKSADKRPRSLSCRDLVDAIETYCIGRQQPKSDPALPVPDALADALARQFRQEAGQVRGLDGAEHPWARPLF